MLVCVIFPVACASRESSYELQSEAEGEVPVSPTDPAHSSAPPLAQEYLLPNQGAADHERGAAAEVRLPLPLPLPSPHWSAAVAAVYGSGRASLSI